MKTEALKFFADAGKHIDTQIENRGPGITPAQIKAACVEYYDSIVHNDFENRIVTLKDGRQRKYISIAWEVEALAKKIKSVEFEQDEKVLRESKDIIADKDEEIKALNTEVADIKARLKSYSKFTIKRIQGYENTIAKKKKTIQRMRLSVCIFVATSVWAVAAYRIYLACW